MHDGFERQELSRHTAMCERVFLSVSEIFSGRVQWGPNGGRGAARPKSYVTSASTLLSLCNYSTIMLREPINR